MSQAGRRRWWRAVAAALVGGGAAAVVWFGFVRNAGAEPIPQLTQPPTVGGWNSLPAAQALPSLQAPATAPVVPAVGAAPSGLPPVPVIPASATEPPKVLPPAELPPLPVVPAAPAVEPPPLAGNPQIPPMMGGMLPIRPADPKPEPKKDVPAVPAPATLPPLPAVPPPAGVAQPPAPGNSAPPVSSLPGVNPGGTVKPENVGGGVVPPVVPVVPPAPVGDPARPTVPAIPAVGAPGGATATPVDLAKPPSVPNVGTIPVPPAPINTTVPTPGDDTMLYLNKTAALAVIGGALMVPSNPAKAGPAVPTVPAAQGGGNKDDKTDVAELKKQIEAANQKLTDIQKDLKTLTEILNGKKDEKGYPLPSDPGVVAQMKKLSDKLTDLEKELDKVKGQTSLRPPLPPPGTDAKAGKGTIRVVNEYPVRISIVVNGTSYRVEPNKTLDIEIPAGEFTYQLLESGAASTKSTIKEKETVTLRIK